MKNTPATYSTGQIASIVGLHPNTVRMYEQWGLIQKPARRQNGYRQFADIHVKQFELTKKAFGVEVLQSGLRKRMVEAVKLSAQHRFDEAEKTVGEYIRIAQRELENAKDAAALCEAHFRTTPHNSETYTRSQAAAHLHVTVDTLRNWELNGLIAVKRKQNGYRIYNEADMVRLRIIRALRCANYSLSAILRMLNRLETQHSNEAAVFDLLNTPDEDEDIVSACDKLALSLEEAIENAYDALRILDELKRMDQGDYPASPTSSTGKNGDASPV
ncbi:MAG: MerR family transcriptional regulator [Eggerthellaceae bacterium]